MSLYLCILACYALSTVDGFCSPVRYPSLLPKSKRSQLWNVPSPQEEIPIITALIEVAATLKDRYFFPGHNGGEHIPKAFKKLYGENILHYDLPELDGLDNIHCPEGPLLRALQLTSDLFEAKRSWFLVNGSTSGVLSAILAAVQIHQSGLLKKEESPIPKENLNTMEPSQRNDAKKDERSIMILGRDSHKASFDGLRLANCDGALLPCIQDEEFGIPLGVDFDSITEALDTYGHQVGQIFFFMMYRLILQLRSFDSFLCTILKISSSLFCSVLFCSVLFCSIII